MTSLNIKSLNKIVKNYQQSTSEYDVLIESGTFGGETIINLQSHFRTLHTIELSEYYYQQFDILKKEREYDNVINHLGDTTKVLPNILESLSSRNKVIFWLDGHYSSLNTARGEKDCPLIEECIAIDNLYKSSKAIVLIDDFRLFGTSEAEDWSNITLQNILDCFMHHSVEYFIREDILVLIIKK